MADLRFSNLCLLSEKEGRAISIAFGKKPTVIQAPNGFGKSAIMKSLYEALGAVPHKVIQRWKDANVVTLLEFSVGGVAYASLRAYGYHAIFDSAGETLIRTNSVTKELGPFLADLTNFKLVMKSKQEEAITPPPAYIFAPFYVDQDASWTAVWKSFKDLFLPRSAETLADYHSGIKGNTYYEAQARIDRLKPQEREFLETQRSISDALTRFRALAQDVSVSFNADEFAAERDKLLGQAETLVRQQQAHRAELAALNEERYLWAEQINLLTGALTEMDTDLATAVSLPDEVECPTCGQHYHNSLLAQFGIVENKDSILASLGTARRRLSEADTALRTTRAQLGDIQETMRQIRGTLETLRSGLTFREVVAAEGRNEAVRLMGDQLREIDLKVADIQRQIGVEEQRRKESLDPDRTREIRNFFNDQMASYSAILDVEVEDRRNVALHVAGGTRGSEGARELIAYYYAFLRTARAYGASSFCPIVVDAPNQQGQDAEHLPQVLRFLVDNRPADSQLIVAVEDATPIEDRDVDFLAVGEGKRRVLSAEQYEGVSERIRPYLQSLVVGLNS